MIYYGLEWKSCDTYMQFKELATAPSTPQANEVRQYAIDAGGVSTMCWKNDAGASVCLPTVGGTLPSGSGAAGRVAIWSTATNITGFADFVRDSSNNQVYFGNDITGTPHLGSDGLAEFDKNANNAIIAIAAHTASVTEQAALHLIKSRGTHASQTVVSNGDTLGSVIFKGHGGTTIHDAASIRAVVDDVPGNNDMPGRLVFFTTPNASVTLTEAMRITSGQLVGIGTTSPLQKLHVRSTATTVAAFEGSTSSSQVNINYNQDTNTRWINYLTASTTPDFRFFSSRLGADTLALLDSGNIYIPNSLAIGSAIAPVVRFDMRGSGATVTAALERDNGQPTFVGYRVTGAATALDNLLCIFAGGGSHTGLTADRVTTSLLGFYGAETWGSGAKGAYATLETTDIGSTTRGIRFLIGPSGQWGIGGTTLGTTAFGTAGNLFKSGGASAAASWQDHTADFLTQYALLAGRSGGQTLIGGTAVADALNLQGSSNADSGPVRITHTITTSSVGRRVFNITSTFNGSGTTATGFGASPTFAPSATVSNAFCFLGNPIWAPPSTVTITEATGMNFQPTFSDVAGAVTTSNLLYCRDPVYSGALKPGTQNGIRIGNMGVSGITNAIGLNIDAQSGATNNFTMRLPVVAITTGTTVWTAGVPNANPSSLVKMQDDSGNTRYMPCWA